MKQKAFVLLSGGIDSSTCLALAQDTFDYVEGLGVYYGQRHAKELLCAKMQCAHYGVAFHQINAGGLLEGGMLTDPSVAIPDASYADLPQGISPTYVPFRNGTLLSIATARAQAWVKAHEKEPPIGVLYTHPEAFVYFGAHAEDAQNWAYPDCTPEFIGAMANAIHVGTYFRVRLVTPLMWMVKSDIVKLGASHAVDFCDTWSCYAGGELHCGTCPTCRARKQAFLLAGIHDPTVYDDAPR